MPPAGVGVQVLANKPVVLSSEFVAVIRSRRSSEVRPQVEGVITDILVKSGDSVGAGRALLQIDASRERATVDSDEASRVAQEAAVRYAQQQYERAKQLLEVGAMSQQEYEQAETNAQHGHRLAGRAQGALQESRVQLQYYRVTAPTTGVVGDVPVRVGDRVTTDTVLTTIDQRPVSRSTSRCRSRRRRRSGSGSLCTSSTRRARCWRRPPSTSSRRRSTTARSRCW